MTDSVTASKFLSLLLRHKPQEVGLELDGEGWAEIEEIVQRTAASKTPLTRVLIEQVVRASDKQRFQISEDGLKVKANQGHSIPIDLGLTFSVPPAMLYHGTASRFLDSIGRQGLVKGERLHVHLSADPEVARQVGLRHGKPVVLGVDSGAMHRAGMRFLVSANGVWLTDFVPAIYLSAESAQPLRSE